MPICYSSYKKSVKQKEQKTTACSINLDCDTLSSSLTQVLLVLWACKVHTSVLQQQLVEAAHFWLLILNNPLVKQVSGFELEVI